MAKKKNLHLIWVKKQRNFSLQYHSGIFSLLEIPAIGMLPIENADSQKEESTKKFPVADMEIVQYLNLNFLP